MKDLATVLQKEFDESWDVFCQRHATLCRGVHSHEPEDLIGSLDQCPALDDDAMANFAYGTILTLRAIAGEMNVQQPIVAPDIRVGRLLRRVH